MWLKKDDLIKIGVRALYRERDVYTIQKNLCQHLALL